MTKKTNHQLPPTSIETRLLKKRSEFSQRLSAITRDRRRGYHPDSAERATELENLDVLDGLTDEAKLELSMIDSALKKLRDGDYGLCIDCTEQIEPGRLTAYPQAQHCLECAERNEPVIVQRTAV